MLEDYLSLQLNHIEEKIKEADNRIKENKDNLNQAAITAKELNAKLDPSMEIFSPLKVNENIKKGIRSANERIDQSKAEIENDKNLIEDLENQRISLVSMLAEFRQDKYKLQRYENSNIPQVLTKLKENLLKAKDEVVSSDLSKIHSDCLQIINECMSGLVSRNKQSST